jgi:hypothetical protein
MSRKVHKRTVHMHKGRASFGLYVLCRRANIILHKSSVSWRLVDCAHCLAKRRAKR